MLQGHGFTETVQDLKNGNLVTIKKIEKIMDSINSKIQGSVEVLLYL